LNSKLKSIGIDAWQAVKISRSVFGLSLTSANNGTDVESQIHRGCMNAAAR